MRLNPTQHRKGFRKNSDQVSKGTATKKGAATLGVASKAEMAATAPVGPRILDNHVQNPLWNDDAAYPAAQFTHGRDKSCINGRGSDWLDNILPAHWNHYCPLYTNVTGSDYNTLLNNYFLRHRKDSSIDEYRDIAQVLDSSDGGANSDDQYEIGPDTNRILGLYGNSGYLNSRNNDPDRTYGDIAVIGRTGGTAPTSSNTLSDFTGWVKHSYYQIVDIPATATKMKFGAYVRVPSDDQLHTNNFGAIEIIECKAITGDKYSAAHGRSIKADMIYIHNDGETLPAVQSSVIGNGNRWEFSGIATSQTGAAPAWPDDFLWPSEGVLVGSTSQPTADTTSIKKASDFGEFKLVERYYGNGASGVEGGDFLSGTGTNSKLKIELIFYEYAANIASASGGTASGSVQFYCPFVQFFSGTHTGNLATDFGDDRRISP